MMKKAKAIPKANRGKAMKAWWTYLAIAAGIFLPFSEAFGLCEDNGTDEEGRVVVSEVIALRCGLSTQDYKMTEDCLKRLAYDMQFGAGYQSEDEDFDFRSFNEEKERIISNYVQDYIATAFKQLVAAGKNKDKTDNMAGKNPELADKRENDGRQDIEEHNKLVNNNTKVLLGILDTRSGVATIKTVQQMLVNVLPRVEVKMEDKEEMLSDPCQGD